MKFIFPYIYIYVYVFAPHVKHSCIIDVSDSIAAQYKRRWVASLTVSSPV